MFLFLLLLFWPHRRYCAARYVRHPRFRNPLYLFSCAWLFELAAWEVIAAALCVLWLARFVNALARQAQVSADRRSS